MSQLRWSLIGLSVVLLVGLTACEPVPPRVQFTVDTTAFGLDADWGDGTCATLAGQCTINAAFQEASEAELGVDIIVPAGNYIATTVVAGDVRVNWGDPRAVEWRGAVTVTDGSRLALDGISTGHPTLLDTGWGLDVYAVGEAQVHRSMIRRLTVEPGGVAVLDRSVVVNATEGEAAVTHEGTLVAVRSSILAYPALGPVLDTAGGTTYLRGTSVADLTVLVNGAPWASGDAGTCSGGLTTSFGYVHAENACAPPVAGDSTGDAGMTSSVTAVISSSLLTSFELLLDETSPLIDAIPLGDPLCDPTAFDLFGTPRGVDGDGDGVAGCDVGAIERPAPVP
jgi:hypothetical protein